MRAGPCRSLAPYSSTSQSTWVCLAPFTHNSDPGPKPKPEPEPEPEPGPKPKPNPNPNPNPKQDRSKLRGRDGIGVTRTILCMTDFLVSG